MRGSRERRPVVEPQEIHPGGYRLLGHRMRRGKRAGRVLLGGRQFGMDQPPNARDVRPMKTQHGRQHHIFIPIDTGYVHNTITPHRFILNNNLFTYVFIFIVPYLLRK